MLRNEAQQPSPSRRTYQELLRSLNSQHNCVCVCVCVCVCGACVCVYVGRVCVCIIYSYGNCHHQATALVISSILA